MKRLVLLKILHCHDCCLASETTELWRYINLSVIVIIIIIIIITNSSQCEVYMCIISLFYFFILYFLDVFIFVLA